MYVSLHNRSAYSFGSALTRVEELAAFAADQCSPAIALTDRAGLYGAVAFQTACAKAGVRPILGTELPLDDGAILTLLVRDAVGYGNLCRLVSMHHLGDRLMSAAEVCDHAAGLIALIGRPATTLEEDTSPGIDLRAAIARLRDAFAGRLYVELAIHHPEDALDARRWARIADEAGVPVVATSESRCHRREHNPALRALASIGTLTLLDAPHSDKPRGLWHLRSPAEMHRLFRRRPDALANTLVIAESCDFRLALGRNRFPGFESPDGRSATCHLRELCVAGCRRRYIDRLPQHGMGGRRPTLDEALARLERELAVIEQVHYAEYFLVFHEIVEYCRGEGIATLARGSAADSLVCYALGVSHACPFRFDLPFDRFLNPERARFSKMADIDLDLPWDRREQVMRWVYDRWGHDRVAMVGAPNTFRGRAAVAELGKVYGLPPSEVHRFTRRLPAYARAAQLERAIAVSPEARELPVAEEPYATIPRTAGMLDGLPRHWAMHPCGLVVSPEPLTGLVPVQKSPRDILVAQFDMDAIEELGFIKIDLLGQAGLSVLRDTVAEIQRTDRRAINLETDIDYADRRTWEMIATGGARGVHHIESPAMTSLIRQCDCRDIDTLTAVVAIIRPGAANQHKKDRFARRHQGREPPAYAHPALEPILRGTYGLMVFEEHILQVAVAFAGMNLGRADVLRRALNKQNQALIAELQTEFQASARGLGRTPAEIAAVWEAIAGFCGFMFNKAHSAEYAVEAFQGAWLKCRWPAHFLAAVLSNYRGFYAHSPTLPQVLYVLEARRLGIGFLPPCVNRSRERFSVEHEPQRRKNRHHRDTEDTEKIEDPCEYRGIEESRARWSRASPGGLPSNAFLRAPRVSVVPPLMQREGSPSNDDVARRLMIRVPVTHIQGLTEQFVTRYLAERASGPFANLADFIERCRPGEAEARNLLDSGALDVWGDSRPGIFWQLRELQRYACSTSDNLFSAGSLSGRRPQADNANLCDREAQNATVAPPIELTCPSPRQVAQREMELLGFPVSIDPLTFLGTDDRAGRIDWSSYVPVSHLSEYAGRQVTVCGLTVTDRVNPTQAGELMKFVTLADHTGVVEALLLPDVYRRFGHLTAAHPILAVTGRVEPFENRNGLTLRACHLAPPHRRSSPQA